MSLQISMRESGDVTILDLRGRATFEGESRVLSKLLQELVASAATKLLLNLEELTQIDSSGFSTIVGTRASLKGRGGDVKLLRPRGHVLETLQVLHLLEVIPSFEDETQALASFGAGSFQKDVTTLNF